MKRFATCCVLAVLSCSSYGAAVTACVGDNPGVAAPDQPTTDADVAPDTGFQPADADTVEDAGGGCDPAAAFGAPDLLLTDTVGVTLLPDELNGVVATVRQNDAGGAPLQLFAVGRPTLAAAFGPPGALDTVNSVIQTDTEPTLTADGLTLYFISGRTGDLDVYVSSRTDLNAGFGSPSALSSAVNTALFEAGVNVRGDGLELFWSARDANNVAHIYHSIKTGGVFGARIALTELTTPSSVEARPVLTADGKTIYFLSDRTGGSVYRMWTARRASVGDPFGASAPVSELANVDFRPSWVSHDGCRIYGSEPTDDAGGRRVVVRARGK